MNFAGISVGGVPANRKAYGVMLPGVDHLRHTHDPARSAFSRGQPADGAEFADELEARIIALHDASNIAAVIVEPVSGAGGVLVPPQGYLQRLRQICDQHGILLIFDEVITGFGRLGKPFASQYFGVTPDLITSPRASPAAPCRWAWGDREARDLRYLHAGFGQRHRFFSTAIPIPGILLPAPRRWGRWTPTPKRAC